MCGWVQQGKKDRQTDRQMFLDSPTGCWLTMRAMRRAVVYDVITVCAASPPRELVFPLLCLFFPYNEDLSLDPCPGQDISFLWYVSPYQR